VEKTEQIIHDFLDQVEKDKVLAKEKLGVMEEQKCTLDRERSELSKAIIRFENAGDQEAVQKLNKELVKRVNEISVLDSKIEAYREMGNNYESEAESIFEFAAQEFNVAHRKQLESANLEIKKSREDVEKAKEVLVHAEKALDISLHRQSTLKANARYIVNDRLKAVMQYMPKEIKEMDIPKGTGHYENVEGENLISKQVYVVDTEGFGDGIEGMLNYYYKTKCGKVVKQGKKALADIILGR